MQTVIFMKWLQQAKETYTALQDLTKTLLAFCGGYIWTIALSGAACYLMAGRQLNYYTAITLASDLLYCLRPCIALSAFSVLTLELCLQRSQ